MPNQINMQVDVQVKFREALDKLYRDDYSLIERNCSERSIVFRLGLYLAESLEHEGFNVDCEYNKNGYRPKALLGKRFNYPDIIVHKRASNSSNLLVVEVKTPNDTNPDHFQKDREKLIGFTWEIPYRYKQGVHVYIAATTCSLVWYVNGEIREHRRYAAESDAHELSETERSDNTFDKWYNQFL